MEWPEALWFERPWYAWGLQWNPYYWYWHDYRRRLEPYTYEWRRHVAKWWWVVLIKVAVVAGLMLWLLLWPPVVFPFWAKVTIVVIGALLLVFWSWLLLHLGGYCAMIIRKIRRENA